MSRPTQYPLGSLVWAKINGFPWWPAIVDDDQDGNAMILHENSITHYHVVFFDVTRSWVKKSNIKKLTAADLDHKSTFLNVRKGKKSLGQSIQKAQTALTMTLKERLDTFGFSAHFNNQEHKNESDQDMPKPKKQKITAPILGLKLKGDLDYYHIVNCWCVLTDIAEKQKFVAPSIETQHLRKEPLASDTAANLIKSMHSEVTDDEIGKNKETFSLINIDKSQELLGLNTQMSPLVDKCDKPYSPLVHSESDSDQFVPCSDDDDVGNTDMASILNIKLLSNNSRTEEDRDSELSQIY